MNAYPWILGGPWYRTASVGGPAGRTPRPILQKYASTDFVDRFLKDPQLSLRFVSEDIQDRLHQGDIYAPVGPEDRQPGDCLKLFLDTHSRFYVVVCELHCQAPGYPSTSRDQVCEAGFVIRRFAGRTTAEGYRNIRELEARRKAVMARLQKARNMENTARQQTVARAITRTVRQNSRGKTALLQSELEQAEKNLYMAKTLYKVEDVEYRWIASPDQQGVGRWQALGPQADSTPQVISEYIHPLYPLIPDPSDPNHSAAGKTIWFGVVPTAGAEVDQRGFAKFDTDSTYAVRCFVRRHQERCPRQTARNDCQGEIVWSRATEKYSLADFFDLNGSGHMPVNIRLPDLEALNRQVLENPVGTGLNVRMNAPPDSALNFENSGEALPDKSGAGLGSEICFFAIPLITIVALFVLRLFLPIVLWLFNLWFLLQFRLCIPPGLSLDIAADLQLQGPDFQINIEAEIALNGSITLNNTAYGSFAAVKGVIENTLNTDASIPDFMRADFKKELDNDFDATVDLLLAMATDFSDTPSPTAPAGRIPQPADGLIYFGRVNSA